MELLSLFFLLWSCCSFIFTMTFVLVGVSIHEETKYHVPSRCNLATHQAWRCHRIWWLRGYHWCIWCIIFRRYIYSYDILVIHPLLHGQVFGVIYQKVYLAPCILRALVSCHLTWKKERETNAYDTENLIILFRMNLYVLEQGHLTPYPPPICMWRCSPLEWMQLHVQVTCSLYLETSKITLHLLIHWGNNTQQQREQMQGALVLRVLPVPLLHPPLLAACNKMRWNDLDEERPNERERKKPTSLIPQICTSSEMATVNYHDKISTCVDENQLLTI